MEFGSKLKDLNMTTDEIDRFTKSFQNEDFRKMLHEYAEEISSPENKKKYEEEIKLLEQERGMDIQFIHPEPYRVLKTSVDGKQKCFINICSNDLIVKPEFRKVDQDGRVGQQWSLPHSLTPGRPDRDAKGNKYTIYDVVFHPDTLRMAGSNKRFMKLIDMAAIETVENGGKAKLDKNNVRVLKIKYKGAPHAAIMRKPIPGEVQSPLDHLSSSYPDEKLPDTVTNQESPKPKGKTQSETKASQRSENTNSQNEPTKPHYTIKYRSFIDLQDFRCSRDSAQSPRPKEVVITIDLPLLRCAGDADLDVTEKLVLLESRKPDYRLELPMAYPVDENKGHAKFNRQSKQLIVTLPVLPLQQQALSEVFNLQVSADDGEVEYRECRCDSSEHFEETTPEQVHTVNHTCCSEGYVSEAIDAENAWPLHSDNPLITLLEDKKESPEHSGDTEEDAQHELRSNDSHQDQVSESKGAEDKYECTNQNKEQSDDEIDLHDKVESSLNERRDDIPMINVEMVIHSNIESSDQAEDCSPVVDEGTECINEHVEDCGRDDVPVEQTPLRPLLREIIEDGEEVVISNATSSGIIFQNSFIYELD
ncbi:hypothetical protein UPYG_G00229940 [Umbra pygmaea]|uniref:Protein kintoun n=1 Tax=Umbra pygmaea TaxID=75934 RepID=A0ABD0WXK6_UMBPY